MITSKALSSPMYNAFCHSARIGLIVENWMGETRREHKMHFKNVLFVVNNANLFVQINFELRRELMDLILVHYFVR